jgi:hypothetical protein
MRVIARSACGDRTVPTRRTLAPLTLTLSRAVPHGARVGAGDAGVLRRWLALGYVEKLEPEVMAQLDEVQWILVALVR